jgi:hypothetical protein
MICGQVILVAQGTLQSRSALVSSIVYPIQHASSLLHTTRDCSGAQNQFNYNLFPLWYKFIHLFIEIKLNSSVDNKNKKVSKIMYRNCEIGKTVITMQHFKVCTTTAAMSSLVTRVVMLLADTTVELITNTPAISKAKSGLLKKQCSI